jgi:alkaline phosphatase D
MRKLFPVLGLLACLAPTPAPGATSLESCQDGIAVAGRKYFLARHKALAGCEDEDASSGGVLCDGSNPKLALRLEAARDVLERMLERSCAGVDLTTVPLRAPCDGLASASALADCLVDDGHGDDVDRMIEVVYDDAGLITDVTARLCQRTITKVVRKSANVRYKLRRNCARRLVLGKVAGPCPDEATGVKLDRVREAMVRSIERKCPDDTVLDPDMPFGVPCEYFADVSFERVGNTNDNAIPVRRRLAHCIAAATAAAADSGADMTFPLPEDSPFSLGVAAGDATASGFTAWTRVDNGSAVAFDVAEFPNFAGIVHFQGGLVPDPAGDLTVKVTASGLQPDRHYYYRFRQGSVLSRIGEIRTAPSPADTGSVRVAWTSGTNAFFKPFTVLESIVSDRPDVFFYVGDTIYADDPRSGSGVATTRAGYQAKYRENRADLALRNVLGLVGTVAIWDEREVAEDYYGTDSAMGAMIADGNEAFRDYMPVKEDGGDPQRLYRSFRWGKNAEFFVIDGRQYRDAPAHVTEPACLDGGEPAVIPTHPDCLAEIAAPGRTYLGATQKAWLEAGLLASTATFKFVINGPPIFEGNLLPYDRWEGYAAEREALLEFIASNGVRNVFFLSTDIDVAAVSDEVPNPGPSGGGIPELVAGPAAADTLLRTLPAEALPFIPAVPALFSSISYFELDRYNYVLVDVDPGAVTFTYKDNAGTLLARVTLAAES